MIYIYIYIYIHILHDYKFACIIVYLRVCKLGFQLDDGWPESVEEQSLLLLVWRHYITRQYIKDVLKAGGKNSIKTTYHKHKTIVCTVNFV